MKKFIYVLCSVLMVALASCANPEKSVADKIKSNEELTQKDYEVMIDYMDQAVDGVLQKLEKEDITNINEDALEKEFNKDYPYADTFGKALSEDINKLDESNKKKYQELMQDFISKAFELSMKKSLKSNK